VWKRKATSYFAYAGLPLPWNSKHIQRERKGEKEKLCSMYVSFNMDSSHENRLTPFFFFPLQKKELKGRKCVFSNSILLLTFSLA
jgi:hypothetical protein